MRFDEEELTRRVATRSRARNALEQLDKRGGTRTLAFCVSQRHADFMADFLRQHGRRAVAVHSGPTSAPRAQSLDELSEGGLDVRFDLPRRLAPEATHPEIGTLKPLGQSSRSPGGEWVADRSGPRGRAAEQRRLTAGLDGSNMIRKRPMVEVAPRIAVDETVRFGRPVIKGTRVPVDTVVGKVASGMTVDEVAEEYGLEAEDVRAALRYAAAIVESEQIRAVR